MNEAKRVCWRVCSKNIGVESWIIFEPGVMVEINKYRQHQFYKQPESCGVLLGERRGQHLLVTNLSTPFPTDDRTPIGYTRHSEGHQGIVNYYHHQSNGAIQYIGEWHTHPQVSASPSITDYCEWARTMESPANKNKKMIFFIAGTNEDWLGLYSDSILLQVDIWPSL